MITINLLREPAAEKRKWSVERSQVGIYAVILMGVAILGLAGWYWHLRDLRADHEVEIERLENENARLAVVRAELQKFQQHKRLLEDRISVIEQLKNNQKGPILLMNSLIGAIPGEPRLWLNNVSQKGKTVVIEGNATDIPALADFIEKLEVSPPFSNVDLDFWEEQKDSHSIKFSLNCEIGRK